ncbi:conserved hypothetical protein [Myxococcus xanthus DK 1622]|uniref:Uncharacterized protein n=1 Tax=Myxococcus xanthus (strain DK1622) TaxID=246197 RepID=Q1DCF5_MYXXD|nr:conserved hypothetical protein [Myxococcus xanthus DK 1622]
MSSRAREMALEMLAVMRRMDDIKGSLRRTLRAASELSPRHWRSCQGTGPGMPGSSFRCHGIRAP